MLLYNASKSLNMQYTFNLEYEQNEVFVPAAQNHALLFTGVGGLIEEFGRIYHFERQGGKGTKKKTIAQTNFATAAFTVLYTDSTPEEGYLGDEIEKQSFYINIPATVATNRVLCCEDFYDSASDYKAPKIAGNKSRRNPDFNQLLKKRITTFSTVADEFFLPKKPIISSPNGLEKVIAGPMFHETFHHSEQAMMHFLSSKEGLDAIAEALLTCKDISYLYGIVLDIYTQRVLCGNCNASLIGLQHSQEDGFLANLSDRLAGGDYRIESRKNLMLSTRVSASQGVAALKLATDKKDVVHTYDPDVSNLIYQAENKALGTKKISVDHKYSFSSFAGAFFTSRVIPSKNKLEKQINIEHDEPQRIILA